MVLLSVLGAYILLLIVSVVIVLLAQKYEEWKHIDEDDNHWDWY